MTLIHNATCPSAPPATIERRMRVSRASVIYRKTGVDVVCTRITLVTLIRAKFASTMTDAMIVALASTRAQSLTPTSSVLLLSHE